MAKQKLVSFVEFRQGGLALNDTDGVIVTSEWEVWDYDGHADDTCCLHFGIDTGDGDIYDQRWSLGGDGSFEPTDDGKQLVQVGDSSAIVNSTNYALLFNDLIKAGLDPEKIATDISKLAGTSLHFLMKAAPGRESLDRDDEDDDKRKGRPKRGAEYLGVTEVYSWGYDAKKGRRKGAKKATGSSKRSTTKTEDVDEETSVEELALDLVKTALADGSLEVDDLSIAVYRAAKTHRDQRNEVRELAEDKKWLAKQEGISVDGDDVSLEDE